MAKRKKQERVSTSAPSAPSNNPFASALAGLTAPVATDLPADGDVESQPAERLPTIKTRIERKGRGGKTVTIVSGLGGLPTEQREELARGLRKALGTGAVVEGDEIVAQGDVGERVERWFDAERTGGR